MDQQTFLPLRTPTARRIDASWRAQSGTKGRNTSRSRISPVGLRVFRCLRQARKRLLNEAARGRVGFVQQRQRNRELRVGRKTAYDVPEGTSHAIGERKRERESGW
ncbi:hypothetical protein C5615_37220 [Burkholderia cepacia]|uniref:Uncharacterized protein n=1 Tax=Burkholderia cepacia TaxID=292 RepID=A0A2S8HZ59_BURCE|nr:hypothetical protein C5615_37220 [Burkholderia cepacia]